MRIILLAFSIILIYSNNLFASIKDLVDSVPNYGYEQIFKGNETDYYKYIKFREENCKQLLNIFFKKVNKIKKENDFENRTNEEKNQIINNVNDNFIKIIPITLEKMFTCKDDFLMLNQNDIKNNKNKTSRILLRLNLLDEEVEKNGKKEFDYLFD